MRHKFRLLRLTLIALITMGILWISIEMARARTGDPSDPHPIMGPQLIQHSLFNRLIK